MFISFLLIFFRQISDWGENAKRGAWSWALDIAASWLFRVYLNEGLLFELCQFSMLNCKKRI